MNTSFANPHSYSIEEVFVNLSSNQNGLTSEDAKKRLIQFGPNKLPEERSASPLFLLIKQFKSLLVIILIIAAIFSWFVGQVLDTWVIVVVVIINSGIGFSQEYRAEKAIAALQKMIVKTAKAFRSKELMIIPAQQLVIGDVIVLEEGDHIPADGRIIQSKNLRTTEASLTGESLPVSKKETLLAENTALADRINMVWKGTFVVGGYSRVIVTGTAGNTAIGEISTALGEIKSKRPNFLKKTDVLAKQMSLIAVVSASTLFVVGYFYRGFEIQEILMISIAALVAAVPEGLPAVISIVLAIGAHRMAKRNAIIREFNATESLGAVTTILTDKTGTLTQNTLTVQKVFIPGENEFTVTGEGWFPIGNFLQSDTIIEVEQNKELRKLLRIATICNNSTIHYNKENDSYDLVGDPTEGALLVLARKGGKQLENLELRKLDDLPFNSNNKFRATLVEDKEGKYLSVIGAPEKLLKHSEFALTADGEVKLMDELREEIQNKILTFSNHAMRVIALAYKKQEESEINEASVDHLVFAGIVGMIDPPRPDSREAVEKCHKAGVRVIMVTGDHVNTAVAIAKSIGIIEDKNNEVIALTEKQLLQLNEDEFDRAISNISVFARLTPKMKLKIAKRLQAMGHLIAMTGDGVNDALALKQADVGISMGIIGTDVARNASDVVLADDNFATLVNAVEEGRIVFANSRQTSFFLITTNIAESVTLIISIMLGFPLPLTATQLLWLNLVTDGVTDMALATEPGHSEIMQNRPIVKNENILNKEIVPFLFINVVLMTGMSLATFYYYLDFDVQQARTGVFVVMASTQLFNIFNLRSLKLSVFDIGVFSNKYINLAVAGSILMTILITEIPQLTTIFHFESLPVLDFVLLFMMSSCILWFGEAYKFSKKWIK